MVHCVLRSSFLIQLLRWYGDEQATLAEVFVYDITSTLWFTQQTTDTLGRSNFSDVNYNEYGPGIPLPRYHMCTVAAAAPDKTSWNIYVFGGQNDTFTPGDIWVLSFPR